MCACHMILKTTLSRHRNMNVSQIPDNVLLKIFRLLPPRDFIRCGLVNELFRKISIEAMSQIKSIDLEEKIFQKITEEELSSLFEKCWRRLEKIKFRPRRPEFIEIFEDFSFPKLVELHLSYNRVSAHQFAELMRQNRNIEILKCASSECNVIFPEDVVCEKLLTLDVQLADENFFVSATGRCPNLRSLEISELRHGVSGTRLTAILNDFFASCSELIKFGTKDASINLALTRADSFCRLHLLEIAVCVGYPFDEIVFDKFISSFPDLEVVSFNFGYLMPNMVSKVASLPKLRGLSLLDRYPHEHVDLDQNLLLFVRSEVLQHLEVRGSDISSTTLMGFICHCPQLSFLWINRIKGIETAQEAANFIRLLDEFLTCRQCHLIIRLEATPFKIWKSKEVKDALKEVEETSMFEIDEDW